MAGVHISVVFTLSAKVSVNATNLCDRIEKKMFEHLDMEPQEKIRDQQDDE
jgi:GTPase Era involved in 16S rRNA processing